MMNQEAFKTIRERWQNFAQKHPRLAVYGEKLADYARNGIMRDSETVEFNTHFTGRMLRQTFWLTIIGLLFMAVVAQGVVRLTLGLGVMVLNYVGLMFSNLAGGWLNVALNGLCAICRYVGFFLLDGWLLWLLVVAVSAAVRRMHDIGKSGWYVLVALIPGIGFLILAIMCCMESAGDDEEDVSEDDVSPSDEESAEPPPQPVNPVPQQTLPSSPQVSPPAQQSVSCSLCHGEGKLPNGFPCPQCGGSGKA